MQVSSGMVEAFVVRKMCIRQRACVARARRVERSVLMVLGQYGREVLEWRTGGRGLRGRVCSAVWKESVRMRVRRSASSCSDAGGGKGEEDSRS